MPNVVVLSFQTGINIVKVGIAEMVMFNNGKLETLMNGPSFPINWEY